MDFRNGTKKDAELCLCHELERLKLTAVATDLQARQINREFDGFKALFESYLSSDTEAGIQWSEIEKLPSDSILDYARLKKPSPNEIRDMLNKLVVVKLNGGLGTSMGCKGPKSVIPVRDGLTFLDLTVQQIENLNKTYDADVPLLLMDSFNTDEETQKVIKKYSGMSLKILTFNQSKYPRISRESLMPIAKDMSDTDLESWYPPGHGDFYKSLENSGLLDNMLENGREYCFMSNIDNMGATVDLAILDEMIRRKREFIMEVTEKTRADVKGGTLIKYQGKLRLLEVAQVPKEYLEDFKSVKKFNVFNTNNIWVNLRSIKKVIEEDSLNMEVIVNNKTLENGANIIQLETAVGAAMKCFDNCCGVKVPRSRFLPVKKTSDLLLIMSNLYTMNNGSLLMSQERMFQTTPLIKLGDQNFKKVSDFLKRFASVPDILELDHLTVSGNVTFGRNASLKGTVIIIANCGERIDIPDGAVIENKIVSGNLRILDH